MRNIYGNKKVTRRREPRFELSAGVLCLDFVNTLDDRPSGEPKELLKQYMDLVRFAEDTGILEPDASRSITGAQPVRSRTGTTCAASGGSDA